MWAVFSINHVSSCIMLTYLILFFFSFVKCFMDIERKWGSSLNTVLGENKYLDSEGKNHVRTRVPHPESHPECLPCYICTATISQAAPAWRNELGTVKTSKQQAPCLLVTEHYFPYLIPFPSHILEGFPHHSGTRKKTFQAHGPSLPGWTGLQKAPHAVAVPRPP